VGGCAERWLRSRLVYEAEIVTSVVQKLIIYKLISTRLRDHEDARSVVRRQGDLLDDEYVIDWLRQFEQALDDSTLVAEYQNLRQEAGGK
jgi:hypothetical protein